ncbi:hypothetical protein [Nocardioides sp.]|jgi:hypothetical protein|uniref:hypothetical protein n=1 Tax=Nocardioides sp. TaxID=35761 RepID=UPI002C578312|nr:hypothetical protein [Nocardioides sp.]HVX54283.1 hypothetical protein [Nocardioides sp.]
MALPDREATAARLRRSVSVLRPTACFTHLSSAIVRGWWLPQLPDDLPIWVAQIQSQYATRRSGFRVIRGRAIPTSKEYDGLRLAIPAETLVTCAIDLALLDLVVLLDSSLHAGDISVAEVAAIARERRRGAPRLRQAIDLCDARSESAMESAMRVLHTVSGIAVEPQREFRHLGRFVARGDLWLIGTTTIHEYDGDEHLEVARQRHDLRRGRRLAAAGITRRGYTIDDVARGSEIIQEACATLGRPFSMEMLEPWWALWNESCFSPLGRLRLAERLSLPRARQPSSPLRPRGWGSEKTG